MEMGHSAGGMAGAGLAGSDINSYTASNAIFYSTTACVTGNESCAASTAWQTKNAYVASTPLTNRFVKYRMYWTDSQIRFTVIDNNVEHDMYASPIPITTESSEFQAPFYFLFNLAVGGNFTDAANPAQVTAPLPGTMYIDYIRVYQLDGKGEVKLGSQVQKETGTFGVFTDNTATANKQQLGVDADFWIWNTASTTAGTLPAYEGSNVLTMKYTAPGQWFGGGIASRQARDMSNLINGNLKFRIKIPANVAFKVGIQDTYTNQNYVNFPANQTTYGLVRTGDWAQASVPIADLRGSLVALQSLSSLFNIVSIDGALPGAAFELAIDDIVWECGSGTACQTNTSSSKASSSTASVRTSSSVASSLNSVSSTVSSTKSSVASSAKTSSSSSTAATNGYRIVSNTSVSFFANNTAWADIHFTVNGGAQQNVRMTHNADNSNTYTLTAIPAGAVVRYSYTIGQSVGALDTAWVQFTLPASVSSASSSKSSVSSAFLSSKSSVASSSTAAVFGYTKPTATSVRFYANNSPWVDVHYTINGGGQQNVRMLHSADNSNSFSLTGVRVGAVVRFSYTMGQNQGASDTAWMQFTQ
jgi:hypothetical protein